MIKLKTEREIEMMRQAGALAAQAMVLVGESIRPGMTTQEVDDIFWKFVRAHGGKASFYRYGGFPGHICISINDEIVHGIPGDRVIQEGDIVSVDLGVELHGYQSDMAKTFFAGKCSKEAHRLVEVTE
ncbi:MAG: M24 family metallopeptidase, partial [Acutalibacteraceae bacterium]